MDPLEEENVIVWEMCNAYIRWEYFITKINVKCFVCAFTYKQGSSNAWNDEWVSRNLGEKLKRRRKISIRNISQYIYANINLRVR